MAAAAGTGTSQGIHNIGEREGKNFLGEQKRKKVPNREKNSQREKRIVIN